VTDPVRTGAAVAASSLGTAAARNLATTTKSVPQMQGISPRWLLRMLPWVHVPGGTYRVNRRLRYTLGDGRVSFVGEGDRVRVVPGELRELALLRGFDDEAVLAALADRFEQREFAAGEVLVEFGHEADGLYLIAHGKVRKLGAGEYGERTALGVLAGGDYFGEQVLTGSAPPSQFTVQAATAGTVLVLPAAAFQGLVEGAAGLRAHLARAQAESARPQNSAGEASIDVAAGHRGEPALPTTFVDYELRPREYELSVAQTVLRVHTRIADLYNQPMNQVEQQLRLTIEALRERQEHELVNNPDFGLLRNADRKQRIHTRGGPPTPQDLDDLLSRRRRTRLLLAHPRAIAAFGRECTRQGIYPQPVDAGGRPAQAWRGVPILPCDKIPVTAAGSTSILAMRTGEDDEGVIGLHRTGLPDEHEPGLSVRFMGIDASAVMSYLVTAYHSAAVLVPDALGILENVEVNHPGTGAGSRR
jgi:CRP-like cAMP-binding protein